MLKSVLSCRERARSFVVATVLILGQHSVRADTSNVMEASIRLQLSCRSGAFGCVGRAFRPDVRSAESVGSVRVRLESPTYTGGTAVAVGVPGRSGSL